MRSFASFRMVAADPAPEFELDNRVKLEYYHLEKTFEGAIELESTQGETGTKTDDQQVYEHSIFSTIFEDTAQEAYMENTAAYEQLFMDAEKYRIIQKALAERLYKEFHKK